MKALSISGFILALLGIATGIYNQFVNVAAFNANMCKTDPLGLKLCKEAEATQLLLGQTIILVGFVSLLLCAFPALKNKSVLAVIGCMLALGAILIGMMQGTHIFDYTGYFKH